MSETWKTDNSGAKPPLLLGIDATSAARTRTGIGHYTASALEALAKRQDVRPMPFVHGWRSLLPLPEALPEPRRLAAPGKALLWAWHHLRRPSVDRLWPEAEVFWSPNYLIFPTRKPLLVTIHDLFFLEGRGQDYWAGAFLEQHLQKHLERRAARVLTDSKATLARLLERYPALEARAEVLYPAIRERFLSPALPEAQAGIRHKFALPEAYWLCIGELSERKNQARLLDAWQRLDPRRRPALVLVGLGDASRQRLAQTSGGAPAAGLHLLPYMDESELHALLSGAHGLVCPSLDEGFGFTALEALGVGVPVACSRTGSLPEVSGGLALYFDPLQPPSIIEALERLLEEDAARRRQQEEGPAWASRFQAERTAEELVRIARSLLP